MASAHHYPPSPFNEANAMLERELFTERYRFKVYGQVAEWQSVETFPDIHAAAQAWWTRKVELELICAPV